MRRIDVVGRPAVANPRQNWLGSHSWRAMTLTPGEVDLYNSFMNNVPAPARKVLSEASKSISPAGDNRPRLQKYVNMQCQRDFLTSNRTKRRGIDDSTERKLSSTEHTNVTSISVVSLPTYGRRPASWAGVQRENQFQATRAIREMVFSAKKRAAGSSKVIAADYADYSSYRSNWTVSGAFRKLGDVPLCTAAVEGVRVGGLRRKQDFKPQEQRAAAALGAVTGEASRGSQPDFISVDRASRSAFYDNVIERTQHANEEESLLLEYPSPPSNTPDALDEEDLCERLDEVKKNDATRKIEIYIPSSES